MEENKKSNIEKRLLPPNTLNDIILKPKQKRLVEIFDNNDIITVTGPAGCLLPDQHIKVYVMKSKVNNKIIYKEK